MIAFNTSFGRDEGSEQLVYRYRYSFRERLCDDVAEKTVERAIPILPADDLGIAKDFYAAKLGFRVLCTAIERTYQEEERRA